MDGIDVKVLSANESPQLSSTNPGFKFSTDTLRLVPFTFIKNSAGNALNDTMRTGVGAFKRCFYTFNSKEYMRTRVQVFEKNVLFCVCGIPVQALLCACAREILL